MSAPRIILMGGSEIKYDNDRWFYIPFDIQDGQDIQDNWSVLRDIASKFTSQVCIVVDTIDMTRIGQMTHVIQINKAQLTDCGLWYGKNVISGQIRPDRSMTLLVRRIKK